MLWSCGPSMSKNTVLWRCLLSYSTSFHLRIMSGTGDIILILRRSLWKFVFLPKRFRCKVQDLFLNLNIRTQFFFILFIFCAHFLMSITHFLMYISQSLWQRRFNCSQKCSSDCYEPCDIVTGPCTCNPGYRLPECSMSMNKFKYTYDDTHTHMMILISRVLFFLNCYYLDQISLLYWMCLMKL